MNVLFFLITGLYASLAAQTSKGSLTAEVIHSKYVEAMGGWKNILAIENLCQQWTNEIHQTNITYKVKPNLSLYLIVDSASQTVTKTCSMEGMICLSQKNLSGTDTSYQLKVIRSTKGAELLHLIGSLIFYKENGYTLSLIGDDTIEGQDCFVIKLAREEKSYDLFYLSQESYRLVMHQTRYATGPDGSQTYYSDYRQVNGVWFAFVEETSGSSSPGKKRIYTSIKVNTPIDRSIFTCPTF